MATSKQARPAASDQLIKEVEANLETLEHNMLRLFDYDMPIRRYHSSQGYTSAPRMVTRSGAIDILNRQTNAILRCEIMTTILEQDQRALSNLQEKFDTLRVLVNQVKTILRSQGKAPAAAPTADELPEEVEDQEALEEQPDPWAEDQEDQPAKEAPESEDSEASDADEDDEEDEAEGSDFELEEAD